MPTRKKLNESKEENISEVDVMMTDIETEVLDATDTPTSDNVNQNDHEENYTDTPADSLENVADSSDDDNYTDTPDDSDNVSDLESSDNYTDLPPEESKEDNDIQSDLISNINVEDFENAEDVDVDYDDDDFEDEDDDYNQSTEMKQIVIPTNIPTTLRTVTNTSRKAVVSVASENMVPNMYTLKEQQKWSELHGFKARHRVVKAMVIKCVRAGERVAAVCQIDGYKEFPITVPYEFMDAPPNLSVEKTSKTRQEQFINRLLGAKINIVIEQLKDGVGIGNRTLANYFQRRKYFYRGYKKHIDSKKRVIGQNSIINDAQVIGVYENFIKVEFFGATAKIPVKELTNEMVSHGKELYYIGDKIQIKIKEIKYLNDEGRHVRVKASAKDLMKDDALIALDKAELNESVLAVVKKVSYLNGNIFVCTNSGYNAVITSVAADARARIKIGSIVRFRLTKKQNQYGVGVISELIHP